MEHRDRFGNHAAHCDADDRGMVSSTVLTLIVIPVLYALLKGNRTKIELSN